MRKLNEMQSEFDLNYFDYVHKVGVLHVIPNVYGRRRR